MGYAGGSKPNPTYYDLGNHSETLQVDYDPRKASYRELLEVFWSTHVPTRSAWSTQYASLIMYHDEEQRRLAEESKRAYEARTGKRVHTRIVPAGDFYLAEDYHQKYVLRGAPRLTAEYSSIYPDWRHLVDSTAAARVNGYLGGFGSRSNLERNLDRLGLSEEGMRVLSRAAERMPA